MTGNIFLPKCLFTEIYSFKPLKKLSQQLILLAREEFSSQLGREMRKR